MICNECGKPLEWCDSPHREFVRNRWVFFHWCCWKHRKPCAELRARREQYNNPPIMDGTVNEVTV